MSEPTKTPPEVLRFCDQIRNVDDRLGQFSDHEGGENGPTFALWEAGEDLFQSRCDEAIRMHQQAIRLWRKGRLLPMHQKP